MKTRETVQPKPMTLGQQKELLSAISEAFPTNLSFDRAKYWIGDKKKLGVELRKMLKGVEATPVVSGEVESWITLYREIFGIELDTQKLEVPTYKENTWIVPADERVTCQMIYDACKKLFNCDKSVDLSKVTDLHQTGTTVRRFKANVEADEEHKNKSANDLKKKGLEEKSITLRERMLLELWYFKTTGRHLDVGNWTLCNGSRVAEGCVPSASWSDGGREFYVGWDDFGYSNDNLRSRVAVS